MATVTPSRVTDLPYTDLGYAFSVQCEGGCGTPILSAKERTSPTGEVTIYTAPAAVRCIACGPFPAVET